MNTKIISVEPEVSIKGDTVITTSLAIAKHFNKRHGDIMRAIGDMEVSEMFRERNFALSEYTVEGQSRKYPYYEMTRDGWTLLVMGFTGREATQFKEAYIAAFNAMEEQLRQCNSTAVIHPETVTIPRADWEAAQQALALADKDRQIAELALFKADTLERQLAASRRPAPRPAPQPMSDREREDIIILTNQKLTRPEIAQRIGRSVSAIYMVQRELGLINRPQAEED